MQLSRRTVRMDVSKDGQIDEWMDRHTRNARLLLLLIIPPLPPPSFVVGSGKDRVFCCLGGEALQHQTGSGKQPRSY